MCADWSFTNMNYYVYKIKNINTGQYYIGKRETIVDVFEDAYMGSGTWIRKCAKEFKKLKKLPPKATTRNLPFFFVKDIILICNTRELVFNMENELIGNLWYTDPLCMNKCPGGNGGSIREYNLDHTKYHFYDLDKKLEFYATKRDLKIMYPSIKPYRLINGTLASSSNVVMYENRNALVGYEILRNKQKDDNIYHFYDLDSNLEMICTKKDISEKYNISITEITKLVEGKYNFYNSIVMIENKDNGKKSKNNGKNNVNFDSTLYDFFDTNTKQEFKCTKNELRKTYNMSSSLPIRLIRGDIKSCKGVVLLKKQTEKDLLTRDTESYSV